MELIVEGVPSAPGVSVELIREASIWMLSCLMAEDMDRYRSIKLEIDIVDDMMETYGRAAECNYTDDRLRPSSFYIDIDANMHEKPMLLTLGHELTHIKQMAFGQRQESLDGKGMRWMGMLIYPGDMNYYDLPWEIEAHGREFGLYDRFIHHKQGKVFECPATIIDDSQRLRLV